jgi:hypothetical protein
MDRRMILKYTVSTKVTLLRKEFREGCFEHNNNFPDSMKGGEFIDQLRNCQLFCFMLFGR